MQQRIREAFAAQANVPPMAGPVEVDEPFIAARRGTSTLTRSSGRSWVRRQDCRRGGVKDRTTGNVSAAVVEHTDAVTSSRSSARASPRRLTFTHTSMEPTRAPESRGRGVQRRRVRQRPGPHEWGCVILVDAQARLLWDLSPYEPKHLKRYVLEFLGRHNIRDRDTIEQMAIITRSMAGKWLQYQELIA